MEENLRVHYGNRSREDDIRDALHKLDEKDTAARKPGPKRRRKRGGEFIVRGPDWLWCIDGHDKCRNYGIAIYAGVDAFLGVFFGSISATAKGAQCLFCAK